MKKILLFNLLLLFTLVSFSQTPTKKSVISENDKLSKDTPVIFKAVCIGSFNNNNEPLIVVDGILYEAGKLKNVNPDEIESIYILKDSTTFLCNSRYGVIIITTKNMHRNTFIIKDKNSGNGIGYATLIAISKNRKDTSAFVADEFGKIEMSNFKSSAYTLKISCVGYKTKEILLEEAVKNHYEISLKKDEIELSEISIVSYERIMRCGITCCGGCVIVNTSLNHCRINTFGISNGLNIYPNPAKAGTHVNILLPGQTPVEFSVRLISSSGQEITITENEIKTTRGQISFLLKPQLCAGIYFVQLVSKNKMIVSSGKIIVL